MKYETWWVVHLYTYLGLGLAFMHQIRTGVMFLGHENTIRFWTTLWVGTGVMILLLRVGVPLVRNQQYQLRVANVTQEAPNVYSLTVTGKNIKKMAVSGGQFFQWRFMAKGLWWHSHPYSLSALPRPPFLRVTVKGLGDQSSAIAQLKPGTRVFVEGPYGVFTHHATTDERRHPDRRGSRASPRFARCSRTFPPTSTSTSSSAPRARGHRARRGDEVAGRRA